MKKIWQNTFIFIIFFICFLFKDYFYNIISTINSNNNEQRFKAEIEILKSENNELKKKLETTYELQTLKLEETYDYVVSKISIRNPFTFYDSLIINKGSIDGIDIGMAVVTEKGLVGKISSVTKNSSKVDLITNSQNDISIIVHGSYGILNGYSKEHECLIINNLNNYNFIEIGDLIYTSGLSKLPGSILIGKVSAINYDRYQIEKNICVESKVNLDTINYVAVVINNSAGSK